MGSGKTIFPKYKSGSPLSGIFGALGGFLIVILILLALIYRDQISVGTITDMVSGHTSTAVWVILMLFAVKSLSVVIPCGVLYAASGILFPRVTALLVNLAGTIIMVSLPFWLARIRGGPYVASLIRKHPKMALLQDKQSENNLFLAFILRIIGIFPCDLVSAYFGITGIPYGKYLLGTTVGFLPSVLLFTIMGMSAHDLTSPAFLVSVGLECIIGISSCICYRILKKKQKTQQGESEC